MALRILLASMERAAARYKRYIVPCLSLSIDFYVRVFVRIYTSREWLAAGGAGRGARGVQQLPQRVVDTPHSQAPHHTHPPATTCPCAAAAEVKNSASKLAYLWQSTGCDTFTWQRVGRRIQRGNGTKYQPGMGPAVPQECPQCGSAHTMGGPFWAEPIHDMAWVQGLLRLVNAEKSR